MGKIKKVDVEPELSRVIRWTSQNQEGQHRKYRHAGYDNHRRPRSSRAGFTFSQRLR
jgi:hypothetical protein